MKLIELEKAVRGHTGEFQCESIDDATRTKVVRFAHVVGTPDDPSGVPGVGRLRDFYETFGSIVLYYDTRSKDAGRYIAPVSRWASLREEFSVWFEDLEADELELLPEWIGSALVIGETPHSGNYVLVPTEGPDAGHVFEFDHDDFEFMDRARDIVEYVESLLKPDSSRLTDIATYMRFVERKKDGQWWIRELRDNDGHVVRNDE